MGRAKWWELLIVFVITLFATAIFTYIAEAILLTIFYWLIKRRVIETGKEERYY